MCDAIVLNFENLYINNPATLASFGTHKGLECIVKVLHHLSETYTEENYTRVFKVVESLIHLLTVSLQTPQNAQYFRTYISFSALLEPLHKLRFIQNFELGSRLVIDLFRLSVMLWEGELNTDDILLFYNPEVISQVMIPVSDVLDF
jgi:hypothetical protein